jgi:hypothetical protein
MSGAGVIEHQRAGWDASHHSVVGSDLVIAPLYYILWRCGLVSAVGTAREGMEGASDCLQRPLRSRFRQQLSASVRPWRQKANPQDRKASQPPLLEHHATRTLMRQVDQGNIFL